MALVFTCVMACPAFIWQVPQCQSPWTRAPPPWASQALHRSWQLWFLQWVWLSWYESGWQTFLFENALSHHAHEIEMPIPSHLVAQGPQTCNICGIPCYLRMELVLPGLNPAISPRGLDAESSARWCQVGTRLVAGGLLGPHSSARPRYVGGLRLPTPPPVCGKEPAPLDCTEHFSFGAVRRLFVRKHSPISCRSCKIPLLVSSLEKLLICAAWSLPAWWYWW